MKGLNKQKNPKTQTTESRWPEGSGGGGWVGFGKGVGEMGTSVIVSTIKIELKTTKILDYN